MLSLSFRVQAYDEEIASKLVSMTQTEDAEIVNEDSPFKTKRLIVETYENIELMGAVDYVKDDGYYILQYKNEEDTQKAYEYYSLLESVEYVEVDAVIKSEAVSDYSYVSWGGEAMDVGSYSNYLNESIGKNNLKEIIINNLKPLDNLIGRVKNPGVPAGMLVFEWV